MNFTKQKCVYGQWAEFLLQNPCGKISHSMIFRKSCLTRRVCFFLFLKAIAMGKPKKGFICKLGAPNAAENIRKESSNALAAR